MLPHKSARNVLIRSQRVYFSLLAGLFAFLLYCFPTAVSLCLLLVINVFYLSTILLKCWLFVIGSRYQPGKRISRDMLATISEDSLPIYTILVPLHNEVGTIHRLIDALNDIDYPKSKLDIKLIVECDDEATIEAIKKYNPHYGYELIYVPYSLPQTKPKACNYALHFARGKYVTIYDAEDIPDTLQLKKSVYWFSEQPDNVVCLQARLNYYNRNDSLLTRLFSIEYAAWFDFMLPGLRHLHIPIPLGGTSNHIRLDALRELGEWDPYNVTEDADLGIRLALQHYETDLLDSLTSEEAPIRLGTWMNQRTRWIRGYMQTWLVHMRHPLQLMRQLSPTAFWGFQFFVGGPCLVFLSAPVLWSLCVLWFLGIISLEHEAYLPWITPLSLFNLLFGLMAHGLFATIIIRRYRWTKMLGALCMFPLYWLLHSMASFKALWQLVINPHIWEKTPHGLSAVTEEEKIETLRYMQ
jgi:cellulose synthase/poly-beta-1,6-N-acetylglucosamine synthase-like glycosyltransferase